MLASFKRVNRVVKAVMLTALLRPVNVRALRVSRRVGIYFNADEEVNNKDVAALFRYVSSD